MNERLNDEAIEALAADLGGRLASRGWMVATAESCTGGWIAKALTDVPGSSGWFDRGFVTYSNAAKQAMLGVREDTLSRLGAVSEEVVREMAIGALSQSLAQVAIAVSGIAGPGGGSPEKPVGTVWLAWALPQSGVAARAYRFEGDREVVRRQSVIAALQGLLEWLQAHG